MALAFSYTCLPTPPLSKEFLFYYPFVTKNLGRLAAKQMDLNRLLPPPLYPPADVLGQIYLENQTENAMNNLKKFVLQFKNY